MKKILCTLLSLALILSLSLTASAILYEPMDDGTYRDESQNETVYDPSKTGIWHTDGSVSVPNGKAVESESGNAFSDIEFSNLPHGWYELEFCELGYPEDFDAADAKGKIAVIARGTITFQEKAENAKAAGAVAVMIVNNAQDAEVIDETNGHVLGTHQTLNPAMEASPGIITFACGSDTGIKIMAEATGCTPEEAYNGLVDAQNGGANTGVGTGSTKAFIGTYDEYRAAGEFSADKKIDAKSIEKAQAEAAAAYAERMANMPELLTLDYPTMAAAPASEVGYATLTEAAAAIGKTPITVYDFLQGTGSYSGETPDCLWDNDTSTKFCSAEFPTISQAQTRGEYSIDGVIFATANDNASYNGRSPYEWAVYGSKDGKSWTAIAYGDDTFFLEENFTYFPLAIEPTEGYKYFQFQSEGGTSGTFQVSELVLCGTPISDEKAETAETTETPAVTEGPTAGDSDIDENVTIEEPVTTAENAKTETTAPQTFDAVLISAVCAVVSLAGYSLTKKK